MGDPRWNLDELAERVDAALAVGYRGQPSGRVRAVPDRRAIRWYTTIGLIDRPVAYQGRTALYGPRHLLQLVAVKRLQAEGLPLVAIQQELAGATDTQLARVAHLPAGTGPAAAPAVAHEGLQAAGAAVLDGERSRTTGEAAPERTAARTATGVPRVARAAVRRSGFWRQQPAAAMAAVAEGADAAASATPADPASAAFGHDRPDPGGIATLQGIRLGEGATLLLEPGRELDPADVAAILAAAGPLLAALRDRGLGVGTGTATSGSASATGPGDRRPTPGRRATGNEPRREQP
jgi:DNA-binding transcriptional MerR regulator